MFKSLTKKSSLQAKIVTGSIVLLSGSGLATAINFGYNIAVAQFLGPKGYGHATAVYTLLILASSITLSFQIVSAKIVAQQETLEAKGAGYRSLHRQAWACGALAAVFLLAFRNGFADYLNLPSPLLIVLIAVGAAFYIPLGSRRGYLQGAYGFRKLATNLVIEGAVRLVGSVLLMLLGFGVSGVIAANSAAVAIAYFAIVPHLAKHVPSPVRFSRAARELLLAVGFFAGQVLINNSDIVLVKHFFLAREAGLYAAIAMVGRVIFTLSQSVVNSMFPLVAGSREEDRRDFRVIATALALVLAIGSGIAIALRFTPDWVWKDFFGEKFEIAGPHGMSYLLALYAVATVIYALSAVVITFEMSYKIANTTWVQLAVSGAVIGGICVFHSSLEQVIVVKLVLMVALLLMVALPFVIGSLSGSGTLEPSGTFRPLTMLRPVCEDEVIAEFLKSDFHRPIFLNYQEEMRDLVFQPNLNSPEENAKRRALFFVRHLALWNEIPSGTKWHEMEVRAEDLERIRVFPRAQWRKIGKGNFKINDIVNRYGAHEYMLGERFQGKIAAIRGRILGDGDHLGPVILIGVSNSSPLTILDGNHRLVAALLASSDSVGSLRFFCGTSPKMKECCWYNTNLVTLFRYGRNVLLNSVRRPEAELAKLSQKKELATRQGAGPGTEPMAQAAMGDSMSVMIGKRKVMVKQVPAEARAEEERMFLREIQECVETNRPRIVLDCSNLRQLDKSSARLLLRCLEEAMKRNGDVKLASLPIGAGAVLEMTGMARIFEVYGTVEEAENSFYEFPKSFAQHEVATVQSAQGSESAA
ncbi:MAG: STAS domain-containing protein [Acidobacteriaceae bacterium]